MQRERSACAMQIKKSFRKLGGRRTKLIYRALAKMLALFWSRRDFWWAFGSAAVQSTMELGSLPSSSRRAMADTKAASQAALSPEKRCIQGPTWFCWLRLKSDRMRKGAELAMVWIK